MSFSIETIMLIGIFILAICCFFCQVEIKRVPRGGTPIGYELPMDYDMNDIRQMRDSGPLSNIERDNVLDDLEETSPNFNYADPTEPRGGGNPEMAWLMDGYNEYLPASELRFPRINYDIKYSG